MPEAFVLPEYTPPVKAGGDFVLPDYQPSGGTSVPRARTESATDFVLPDYQRKTTGLERVLDALAVPSHASAGFTRGIVRGENPLETAAAGVRNRTTYGDLLRDDAGMQGPAAAGLGLLLDIGLDPTTYLSAGLSGAGKAAKAATLGAKVAELSGDAARIAEAGAKVAETGRLGANLAEQARLGQRAVVSAAGRSLLPRGVNEGVFKVVDKVAGRLGETDAAQALRKAFLVAPELKGLDRDVFLARQAEVRAAARVAQKRADEVLAPVAADIGRIVRQHKLNPVSTQRALADAVELAKPAEGQDAAVAVTRAVEQALTIYGGPLELKPHMEELVTRINAINASNLAAEQASGIPIKELADPGINYLFRSVRPEAADELAKAGITPEQVMQRGVSFGHSSQNARGFRGLTITQINELARNGQLVVDGTPLPALKNGLFVENPFVATSMRAAASGRVQSAAKLLGDYADSMGAMLSPDLGAKEMAAEREAMRAKGFLRVGKDVTGVNEVWLPKEVAIPFQAHLASVERPSYFLRAWDASNRLWKKYTLGIFPVYHTRNLIGDAWNSVVLGGQDLARYGDSMAALRDPERVFRLGGKAVTGKELTDTAERLGVMEGATADLVEAMGSLRGLPENVVERVGGALDENQVLRVAQRVGQARENWQRLALFMDRLHKGDAPEVAALYVKRHLFDYGELTATEQGVFRRIAPFYAFTRNNVPLQLSYLFEKPGSLAAVQHLREEAAGPDGSLGLENGAPLPRFLAEGLPVRIGENAEGNPQFLRGTGWIPATDLDMALDPGSALNRLVSMTSPFLQQPVESAFNVDLFRSDLGSGKFEPQERFPGETETLLGVPLNKRWVRAPLENIRALSEIDKLNPGGVFGDSEGGPFGAPRPHPDPSGAVRGLGLIAGRGYAVDPETEAMRADNRREREISRLRSELTRAMMRGDGPNIAAIERRLAELEQY